MSGSVKRVYLGLPEKFKEIVLWVARSYRTNALSHEPGGSDVVVEYHSERVLGYDWVKYPSKYIEKIFIKDIANEYSKFEEYEKEEQLSIVKKEIARIFARKYESEEYERVAFEKVWDSKTGNQLPWEKLKKFDRKDEKIRYTRFGRTRW